MDRSVVQVISANQNWSTQVYGTTPEYFHIRDWEIAQGRFFLQSEVEAASKVCVLGETVAQQLFGSKDPIGESIRVKQMPCEVVGVLKPKGQSAMGQDQDDQLFMPSPTFKSRMLNQNRDEIGSMMLTSTSSGDLDLALRQVTGILRQRHHLADDADDDFSIRNLSEMAEMQQKVVDTQTAML